ncbi:MAG: hypothetical protein Q8L85_09525 [Alphaproteobacteria bacterium]|nr:hypothetical protein [Alphaproteobacteria bacterium]
MYRLSQYIFITLFLLMAFLTPYIIRIYNSHTAMTLNVIMLIVLILAGFYVYKMSKTKEGKETSKNDLIKRVQKGMLYYLVVYGTSFAISYPLAGILFRYINNPAIDFPYHLLWAGLIGYPLAYLMWIVDKKRYEKMK